MNDEEEVKITMMHEYSTGKLIPLVAAEDYARVRDERDALLAELRKVEAYLEEWCDVGVLDIDGCPEYPLWCSVRAAIAKATGEPR